MAKKKSKRVETVKHKSAERKNIPTEELRDFVKDEGPEPPKMLYPRDPSLDPQLVWKGKDEQDRQDLEVPVVPIYIQEKIHPQAIIDDVRRRGGTQADEQQLDLFSDFNGLDEFDKKIDFYNHTQHWSNRMILGDSLMVMTSLAEKEGLKGQVQMIYIDPPYGIKFSKNWQISSRNTSVSDTAATGVTRQPEQIRAFRDTWQVGVHSYLSYLRDRFAVSRELLTESGSVFVQIGDENQHVVRVVLDEVFGPQNYCGMISFRTTGGQSSALVSSSMDYLLWYAKDRDSAKKKYHAPKTSKSVGRAGSGQYTLIEDSKTSAIRSMTKDELDGLEEVPADCRILAHDTLYSQGASSDPNEREYRWRNRTFICPPNTHWKPGVKSGGMDRLSKANRLMVVGNTLRYKRYFNDYPLIELDNVWNDTARSGFSRKKQYVVETNEKVVERCIQMTTDPGDLVLDPTCGSGTTARVAEHCGRRWITIDTSRVALALTRQRMMVARFPYFLLADSQEGVKKESEISGQTPPDYATHDDIRKGFVCERAPHIMLSHFSQNEEIDAIHKEWQQTLDTLREKLNKACRQSWQEWEIPCEPKDGWKKTQRKLLDEWWKLYGERQSEIDKLIKRNSDPELRYDRPIEDKSIVRVTGPFTVESISPHRSISVEEKQRREAADPRDGRGTRIVGPDQFGHVIIENLRKAGIQNQYKDERLKFDTLEPFAGEWIHATGEYTIKNEKVQRVAVCIGPEHGTVGRDLIKEAAKEAVKGIGFDLLVVCGFAFDPQAGEETTRYGKLEVQVCRMNPDLSMGNELLKKTGAGNLFMIFGEPDVEIRREKGQKTSKKKADDQITVEINGVDVYDPTTGQIRSGRTDDIACWFIDTDYDGESFFVRHAYFTGADEPYDKLKRALKAEIDEDAWADLYSTVSQPFPPPSTGKIAVKVINHYGDEVLKVYEV